LITDAGALGLAVAIIELAGSKIKSADVACLACPYICPKAAAVAALRKELMLQ
jgi:hypothetical protein